MLTLWLLSSLHKDYRAANPRPRKARVGGWFLLGVLCSPIAAVFDLARPRPRRKGW